MPSSASSAGPSHRIAPTAPAAATRRRPRTAATLGAGLALLAFASAPSTASAAAGATRTVEGLHISTGSLVDPAGRLWVADHNGGFCRTTPADHTGSGRIEHPERPGEPGARTCLGGLLPDAGTGPDAAGQPVLVDPTPDWRNSGDEVALIPDGASPSSEVVRAQWNPHTQKFEYRDSITMSGARGRPTSLSVGPDDAVYVGFQRETTIQRIRDAAADVPIVEVVGRSADGRGPQSVAAGRDAAGALRVYVSESTGIRVLDPNPLTTPETDPAPFDLGATAVGSMFYDLRADKLFVGTADGVTPADNGIDRVISIDPKTAAVDDAFATGFSMVGGIGAGPNGNLYVTDDPALLEPTEPMGTGRMFHVGLPAAHVTAGPLDDPGNAATDHFTADRTPAFRVSGPGRIECRVTGTGVDTGWQACAANGTFEVTQALADGTYHLAVRSVEGAVQGLPEALRFTVDTAAPLKPLIAKPADNATVGSSPWFEFTAEDGATFGCIYDGVEPAVDCRPGRTAQYPDAGAHTLQIVAIDRAGNRSLKSDLKRFTVDPTLAPTPAPGWGAGPPAFKGSSIATEGLHVSAGALVDPDGRVWIADHNGGFCRTTAAGEDGPGRLDHPSIPGEAGPRTCLGGLLPEAGTGADAAGQPALIDPTPALPGNGDEMALIPDGASPSSEVHRARWNPASGLFEPVDTVSMIGARIRPTAVAAGPNGEAYVIFQKSGTIQRISGAAGQNPQVDIVGSAAGGRTSGLAVGRDDLGQGRFRTRVYVGEDTQVTSLLPNADDPQTADATGYDLGPAATVSALAYDTPRNDLYIGTANGTTAGADSVHRVNTATGAVELNRLTGYSMVGGLALRPDGVLYVLDDAALLDPLEPLGMGRMFQVGLPAAHATAARARFNVRRPQLTITRDAEAVEAGAITVQCRLRGPNNLDLGWQTCATGTWTPAQDLADGDYRLAVRAVGGPADARVTGLAEVVRFAVDTVAPARPRITSPANGETTGGDPWFTFDAEDGATFECLWSDTTAFAPCAAGYTRRFTTNGQRHLTIRAIDGAGNVSLPSQQVSFKAQGVLSTVTITSGPAAISKNRSPEFRFAADAKGVSFSCRLNTAAFTTCTSPKIYADLADGAYTFEVKAMDALGNVSPVARRTFTVDNAAPAVTVAGPAQDALTGSSVTFAIAAEAGAPLACRLDGNPVQPCGESVTLTGLAAGPHTFEVVATDAAGNASTATLRRFRVTADGVAPVVPPAPPTVQVIDQATGAPLSIRIADIDRRVDLAKLQQAGVTVQVIPAQGTKLIRFRIFKLPGQNRGGRAAVAAAASGKHVVTVYKRVKAGRRNVTLTPRELRKLGVGEYRLEVRAGRNRVDLGKARTVTFRVTK